MGYLFYFPLLYCKVVENNEFITGKVYLGKRVRVSKNRVVCYSWVFSVSSTVAEYSYTS
jgi:hypothetical protein